jgi:hypothetical protein
LLTPVSCDTPIKIAGVKVVRPYGLGVGTTGVIFGAIAIAWLAYLVPHFVGRRDDDSSQELEIDNRFSDSMRIVRTGSAPLLNQDLEQIQSFEVSTPQTRRAAVADLRRLTRLAASRRRRVLLILMAVLSAVVGICAVQLIPWWSVAVPGGLLLIFVIAARFSVRSMRNSLDARYHSIRRASDEVTVFLNIGRKARDLAGHGGNSVNAEPAIKPGVLWDPVPITMPTYVSKPLAPRTVRTIDLSGPAEVLSASPELPVTADAQPVADAGSEEELAEPEAVEVERAATA